MFLFVDLRLIQAIFEASAVGMWGCRKSWQVQEFHQLFTWNFKGFNPKCCRDTPVPVWLSNGSRTCRDYHVCWISRMVLDQSQAEDAFPQLDTNSNCGEDLHLTSRTKPQIHQGNKPTHLADFNRTHPVKIPFTTFACFVERTVRPLTTLRWKTPAKQCQTSDNCRKYAQWDLN